MTPSTTRSVAPARRARRDRRQALAVAAAGVLLAMALFGLWRWRVAAFPVTLVVNGEAMAMATRAESPEALLTRLGYHLRPEDSLMVEGAWGAGARVTLLRARPVQVLADGASREVWTRATRVSGVLADAGVDLAPGDVILVGDQQVRGEDALPPVRWRPPAHRRSAPPWQMVPVPLALTLLRATPVQVMEEGGVTRILWTQADTVAQALVENDIQVREGDVILPGLDATVEPGMRVYIRRATPIIILVDGRTIDARTRTKRVGDALREAGILLAGADQVQPRLDAPVHEGMTIRITRVQERVAYEEELLPFETVWEPDDSLLIDTRRVGQAGRPGVLRRRYRVRYEDGQEVARTLEDEWVVQEPERKVILYGRKIIPRTAMTPDGPITYWRKIRAYTTSYSPSRSGTDPSLPWYGRTRLGFKAGKGVVGVDPAVINMGQKLYVPGYGFAIAGDTGNISGKHVDMGFDDDNYESWHWWSDVYLLWPPPPSYAINYILPNWPRYKGTKNPYQGLVQERP
ncbi:MAG TPA: DUF348 domain-containing protein [Anaerolineae bacterium]|nr:DUF348 domain-containing protein [Caldilineae bacterium]HID35418.1 DUF348 domain-containing protein [Anaerolineae bacterium]